MQLGGLRVVAGSLGPLDLGPRQFQVFLDLSSRLDGALLLLPVRAESVSALLQIGQLSLQAAQAFTRGFVALPLERRSLDLELHDPPLGFIEFCRHRVDFGPQPGGGLVDQVDRLVREKSIGDVPMRKHRRGHERRVLERDAVVNLVALAQAA